MQLIGMLVRASVKKKKKKSYTDLSILRSSARFWFAKKLEYVWIVAQTMQ